jgi:predicted Abi (CAAX) family protease
LPALNALPPVRRLLQAFATVPTAGAWGWTAALLLIVALVILPAGLGTGFLRFAPLRARWRTVAGIAAAAFFSPALIEEMIFRVCLLPHPAEPVSVAGRWLWGIAGLAVFVAAHPLGALRLPPGSPRRAAFGDPAFLLLAALLGAACSAAYLGSGSLWPPVALHWIVVVVWLIGLGGWERLYPGRSSAAASPSDATS